MRLFAHVLLALPVVLGVYAYVVYPWILSLLARRAMPTPAVRVPDPAPLVTVVIPAYNEESQIRGAIEAVLAQDYPKDRRQLLILSDASTDGTDAIVRAYAPQVVELLRLPTRSGKTAAENASIAHIRGEIVINSDASVRLHPSAVRHLVAAMADPAVGVASTRDVSVTATGANANEAEAGYVGYEMRIRALETRAGGIVGASGSGYAIRTLLHRHPVRMDLSRDFSAALTAKRHGFRAVSVDHAICNVPRTSSLQQEYRRKVRTISRGMDTLWFNRDLLDPTRHGLFAWKLISHKLARWLVPVSALPAIVGLLLLAPANAWSRWLLMAAVLLAGLAVAGARASDSGAASRFRLMGMLGALAGNLAVLHAGWRFFHGHEDHAWEPTRRTHVADAR